jgi:cytochrome c oxidase cbb3-type subunit III
MRYAICMLVIATLLVACEREQRRYVTAPSPASGAGPTQMSPLHPGPSASAAFPVYAAASAPPQAYNFESNAVAVNEGKRLFRWYNCNGCHGAGGGAIGPALMDDRWIYGHEPAQIVASILQGRPNGMPSFAGRIPEDQVWKIAAYVRSMSGQLTTDVAPSRNDGINPGPPEQRRDKLEPRAASEGG